MFLMCLNKSSMLRSVSADLVDMAIDHIKISLVEPRRTWHMRLHAYIPGYPTVTRSGCENTSYPHYGIAWLCKCSLPQQDSFHSNIYHTHARTYTRTLLKYQMYFSYIQFICTVNYSHREITKVEHKRRVVKETEAEAKPSHSRIDCPTLIIGTFWTAFK